MFLSHNWGEHVVPRPAWVVALAWLGEIASHGLNVSFGLHVFSKTVAFDAREMLALECAPLPGIAMAKGQGHTPVHALLVFAVL